MAYKGSDPFLHTEAWKRVRAERLRMDHGMCCDCMERYRAGGRKPRRAEMVHHVLTREDRPDLALEISNLRSLCNICHNKRHPEKGGRGAAKQPMQPACPDMRVIKV